MSGKPDVTVVVATFNRRDELMTTLDHLAGLPERPSVIVVDNGSADGTADAVRRRPDADLIALPANVGCGARTVGAERAATPFVAFSDDDSWWAAGSLARAARLLDRHPRLAVVAARVLVGPERRLDPVSAEMRASALAPRPDLPGPPVLGFVACGAVVRRSTFLSVGGFDRRFGIGGEEALLALDLAAAGWDLAYVDEVVAYHHPSPSRDPAGRRRVQTRNALWTAWLRRPALAAAGDTVRSARAALGDPGTRAGVLEAVRGLPWVLRERRPVGARVEADLRRLRRAA